MSTTTPTYFEQEFSRVKQKNAFITGIYIVLTVFIIGYLIWGNTKISEANNPKFIAQLVKYQVENDLLPQSETRLEEFMVQDLPQIFETSLQDFKKDMPTLRKNITDSLIHRANDELAGLHAESLGHFTVLINQHDNDIKDLIVSLEDDQNKKKLQFLLKTVLREQYKSHVSQEIAMVTDPFKDLALQYQYLLETPKGKLTLEELEKRHGLLLKFAYIQQISEQRAAE